MTKAIEIRDLCKSYGKKQVLHGISISVEAGETFALLGVNGAGKTTTLECVEGLRKPDSGSITVCRFDVSSDLAAVQKVLGVQLQSTSLPDTITVKEAMRLFCVWHHTAYRGDLLERFDMAGEYLNKTYAALSTGRKRRLHLALALCHNPKVVILDEPTAGLDVEGRYALHSELRNLKKQGVTILIATHDMAEAETLSDRIAILHDGKIAKMGRPMELTAEASVQSRVIVKTRSGCLASQLPQEFTQPDVLEEGYLSFACKDAEEFLLSLLSYVKDKGDKVMDLRVERASIEDIFISVAGGAQS